MFVIKIYAKTTRIPNNCQYRQLQDSIRLSLDNENHKIQSSIEEVRLLDKKFNKSGLLEQHRRALIKKLPYTQPHSWIHQAEKYQRKMFGLYGSDSGVNPRICFGTKRDLVKQAMYFQILHPDLLKNMVDKVCFEKSQTLESIKQRETEVANKLEKLEQWKTDLNDKIAKKEADTFAAKLRKERLVEDVRRHFGFNVDARDERFKAMLELKEKEDKKKQKEAKRKAKEEKNFSKLVQKTICAE